MGSVPSASTPALNQSGAAPGPSNSLLPSRSLDPGPSARALPALARPISRPPSHSISPITDNWPHGYDADVDMSAPIDMEVPINSLSTENAKAKRKASTFDGGDDSRPTKSRTLGGDRPRESVVVREIAGGTQTSGVWGDPHFIAGALPVPPLYNSLSVRVEGSDDILEGRNSEGDGMCIPLSVAVDARS